MINEGNHKWTVRQNMSHDKPLGFHAARLGALVKTLIATICLSLSVSGCSTIVRGSRQDVEVKTNPPGLQARINTQQCITPCTLNNVSRKTAADIFITHNGIEKSYALDRSFNFWTTIPGNIWNEVWIGLIVDGISGAMFNIENVYLDLDPAQRAGASKTEKITSF